MKALLRTQNDVTLLVLRLALGAVMFAHGIQKVLGVWGGQGLMPTLRGMHQYMHIPMPLVVLVVCAEFLGGLGLLLGFLGRVAALGIGVEMVVAAYLVHRHHFFMNWMNHGGRVEGFEYHILAVAIALAVMVRGSGALSLDRRIAGG